MTAPTALPPPAASVRAEEPYQLIVGLVRALGAAERALPLLVDRAESRVAFGGSLADQGVAQQQIAHSRLEIDLCRTPVRPPAMTSPEVPVAMTGAPRPAPARIAYASARKGCP